MSLLSSKKLEPKLPVVKTLAEPPTEPPRLSITAARVKAEIEQLEVELQQCKLWGSEHANKREVAESLNEELRREFDQWRTQHEAEHNHVLNERDKALRELDDIRVRLATIGEQIDRVLYPPKPPAKPIPLEVAVPTAPVEPPVNADQAG